MASAIRIVRVAAVLLSECFASDFLGVAKVSREDLESIFLAELASSQSTSANAAKARISNLESQLMPMYNVMPKEQDGSLGHNVVRYMLHRFFVHRHGWFIRGLEPGSEATSARMNATRALDSEQAMQAMQEWVPSYLQKFLEGVIGGRGVTLRELAVFAATLEDLVFKEEKGHLERAYRSLQFNEMDRFDAAGARLILHTYMTIFMLRGNFTATGPEQVLRVLQLFGAKKAGWQSTVAWLDKLIQKHDSMNAYHRFDFKRMLRLVEEVGDKFGVVNNEDCSRLKGQLMRLESRKPGRVRLPDFYKSGLKGVWEFNERVEYLRAIGTIDDSDPTTPLVILPNYVAARPNCLVVSSFYVVCCRNECENLLERLEVEIGSSMAQPSHIAKIIARLSSDTVAAPRVLPPSLLRRLQEVAEVHGGEVPLHGRLFAQWMHHAYPRECPFPHESGTIMPETPDEWMQRTQEESQATTEEMLSQISHDSCKFLPGDVECENNRTREPETDENEEDLPWDSTEELLIIRPDALPEKQLPLVAHFSSMNPLRDVMYFLGLSAMLFMVCSLISLALPRTSFFAQTFAKSEKCSV